MSSLHLVSAELYHLIPLVVILVICAVMIFILFREFRGIRKINFNVDDDALPRPVAAFLNQIHLRVIFTMPQKIPVDYESVLLRQMVGRKFPLTLHGMNRNFTFVIHFHGQNEMGMPGLAIGLPISNLNSASDARKRLCLTKAELNPTEAPSNKIAD